MPALPTYVRYWADRMWADLPEKTTPIIAAALKHWDDWHKLTRDRIEEVATALATSDANQATLLTGKADKTTTISAGTGLSGGGDLSTDREFSVEYGTTADTATEGNDSRVVNALQKLDSETIAAGDLFVGRADGKVDRLPRTQAGLILGSGATVPQWITPGESGLGLPTATEAGMIPVSLADGTWTVLHGPTVDKQQLTANLANPAKMGWGAFDASYSDATTVGKVYYDPYPGLGFVMNSAVKPNLITLSGNNVTLGGVTWGNATSRYRGNDSEVAVGVLPPAFRPVTPKTFTVTFVQNGTLYYDFGGTASYNLPGEVRIYPDGRITLKTTALSNSAIGGPFSIANLPPYDRTT